MKRLKSLLRKLITFISDTWFFPVFFFLGGGAKEKYRGVFEIQKSGDKTSSGEIGLDIRTHASPKVGQDQVSRERSYSVL